MFRSLLAGLGTLAFLAATCAIGGTPVTGAAAFTPLKALPKPKIIAGAAAYPGGNFDIEKIADGYVDPHRTSEYASDSKGTDTFIDFDFGKPTAIAAFRHVDRFDIANVDAAELTFSNTPDFAEPLGKVAIDHVGTRGGTTLVPFAPVTARYVRWQVTALTTYKTVGGAEIDFFTADPPEAEPKRTSVDATVSPALERRDGKLLLPYRVTVQYPYIEPVDATLEMPGSPPKNVSLRLGAHVFEGHAPAVKTETAVDVALKIDGRTVVQSELKLRPVRRWVMYILPHSHVDIGYTHVQTEVMQRQWGHFAQAIELARNTADYPAGARFKWNAEVLWAVDSLLREAPAERRQELLDAVRKGWVELDGLYGNELTALCRPEELLRLLDCARRVSRQYDLPIDAAMISDVPGYTWGLVPAMAQSGVKYLSIGPNHCHRIGHTLSEWGDKAFYWVSPSGNEKVLCWMAGKAYSWFHGGRLGTIDQAGPQPLLEYLGELADSDYPYDMVQVRYSIQGDNGPPDPKLPDFVKDWNAKYAYPQLVIATTAEMFREFERRYGDQVPEVRGDFTPYWEDGAGSSARETADNRAAAERLVQAETLWAMLRPGQYPDEAFYAAWRNAVLYDEHTWGAHCSISRPDDEFTLSQWKIKQAFAVDAARQSRQLLEAAIGTPADQPSTVAAVQVFNTCSWPRTDLVVLRKEWSAADEQVTGPDGKPVAAQRLADGRLAFLATEVPPFGAKRFVLGRSAGEPRDSSPLKTGASAESTRLSNAAVTVTLDSQTGAIAELLAGGMPSNLVNARAGLGLNEYVYVAGRDPKNQQRNAAAKITVQEAGPLVASLLVESDAPGCRRLTREVRLIDGLDRVELINVVDKQQVRSKEGVHFGFAFQVPGGVMRMDIPWAVVRPELDQFPGACKNYFTVQRWVDVSNDDFGVTWATVEAPLVEVGAIAMDVSRPIAEPSEWIDHLEPTQTLYSYVMNNYWETNYKASQQGPTTFRYAIRPHAGPYNAIESARFGIEQSQPLIVVPATGQTPSLVASRLRVEPDGVIVTALKPSRDGKALIVRLFGAGGKPAKAKLGWSEPAPRSISTTDLFEEPGAELTGQVDVPAFGIVTLRAELGE
ncbi:MAG: hypothetical protein JXB62_23035 [Pirellulales bacterium]|nr:hypothetical protein [Pirellulales bacterium]